MIIVLIAHGNLFLLLARTKPAHLVLQRCPETYSISPDDRGWLKAESIWMQPKLTRNWRAAEELIRENSLFLLDKLSAFC